MSEISSPYGHAWHADVCDYRRGAGGVAAAQVSRIAPSLPPSLTGLARSPGSIFSESLPPPRGIFIQPSGSILTGEELKDRFASEA